MAYYKLAVSDQILKTLTQLKGEALKTYSNSLDWGQLASLKLISALPKLSKSLIELSDKERFTLLNKVMIEFTSSFYEIKKSGKEIGDAAIFFAGFINLHKLPELFANSYIEFFPDSDLKDRTYLLGTHWQTQTLVEPNQSFGDKYANISNSNMYALRHQESTIGKILTLEQEPFVIQGFAGIGKTTMVRMLVESLRKRFKASPVFLTRTTVQRDIARQKDQTLIVRTFAQAISSEFAIDTAHLIQATNIRLAVDHFGINPLGTHTPEYVFQLALKTIDTYCYSNDFDIQEKHLPHSITGDKAQHLSLAYMIWSNLTKLDPSLPVALKFSHKLKMVSLRGIGFKNILGSHLIFDEGHELPASFQKIIADTKKPTIVLKDDLQDLTSSKYFFAPGSNKIQLGQSVRQGQNSQSFINTFVNSEYYGISEPFKGSADTKTLITNYLEETHYPSEPSAILSLRVLGLIEIVQNFKKSNTPFTVIKDTHSQLMRFLHEATNLNDMQHFHNALPAFAGIQTWDQFFKRHRLYSNNQKLRDFLQNNSQIKNMANFLKNKSTTSVRSKSHILAIADHVKSIEFDSVFLAPNFFQITSSEQEADPNDPFITKKRNDIQSRLNRIYLGATRGKKKIYIPHEAQDVAQEMVYASNGMTKFIR